MQLTKQEEKIVIEELCRICEVDTSIARVDGSRMGHMHRAALLKGLRAGDLVFMPRQQGKTTTAANSRYLGS